MRDPKNIGRGLRYWSVHLRLECTSHMFAAPPDFHAHPLARGGHRQSVLASLLPVGVPELADQSGFERVRVPLRCDVSGGDGAYLEGWYHPGNTGPAVLLMHGLGGSTRSGYMRRAAACAAKAGHAVLALNHRGSGNHEHTQLPYMAGRTQDVGDAMQWLRARAGTQRVLAVGFSLSGNTLLKLVGERQEQPPELALAVCPPVDLDAVSRDLLRWPNHAYDLWLLRSCRRWVSELRGTGELKPRYRVPAFSSMRVFDERYITPVWGFQSRADYYRSASCNSRLIEVRTPAVILSARDDPIVDTQRVAATPRSAWVQHVEVAGGGHLGFLAKNPSGRAPRRWLDDALEHYLSLDTACARP